MQRGRVVDRVADLRSLELVHQRGPLALVNAHAILVVDVVILRQCDRRRHPPLQAEARECLIVASGIGPATFRPLVELAELHPQHGRLEGIEPAVETDFDMLISARIPMHSQTTQPGVEARVIGRQHPAITRSAEVFGREETEAGNRTEDSGAAIVVLGPDGLS